MSQGKAGTKRWRMGGWGGAEAASRDAENSCQGNWAAGRVLLAPRSSRDRAVLSVSRQCEAGSSAAPPQACWPGLLRNQRAGRGRAQRDRLRAKAHRYCRRVCVSRRCRTNGGAGSGTARPPEPEHALSAPVLEFRQGNVVKGQPEGQIVCVPGSPPHQSAAVLREPVFLSCCLW